MDADRRVFVVEDSFADERLDVFLSENLDLTRSHIQKLIRSNHIRVNNSTVTKTGYRLQPLDEIDIEIPPLEDIDAKPQAMDLDIIYEDDDVIVVNKPKNMVVHPAPGHPDQTLVNGLMYHCGSSLSGINGVLRPGIVHRIDRDTTGLLVVCKNDTSHLSLARQFSEHTITRKYQAIVIGNLSEEDGTVNAPLGRNPKDRKKIAVITDGRRAVTHYHVLDHLNNKYNHIECRLETGRTHQIRVHMAHIHHPVLGDEVYGSSSLKGFTNLQGQTLHAGLLGFEHPTTHQYMEFKSPLPQYFDELLYKLKN